MLTLTICIPFFVLACRLRYVSEKRKDKGNGCRLPQRGERKKKPLGLVCKWSLTSCQPLGFSFSSGPSKQPASSAVHMAHFPPSFHRFSTDFPHLSIDFPPTLVDVRTVRNLCPREYLCCRPTFQVLIRLVLRSDFFFFSSFEVSVTGEVTPRSDPCVD